ncbi:MAG: hypothetical protein C0478_06935 [Planctomyces sp.]|nr:hypothetical protein [Planctomyces sp.]
MNELHISSRNTRRLKLGALSVLVAVLGQGGLLEILPGGATFPYYAGSCFPGPTCRPLLAQETQSVVPKEMFQHEYLPPRTLVVTGRSLRETLTLAAEAEGWSPWFDWNIDTSQPASIHLLGQTTTQALQQLMGDKGLGVSRIDSIVYVGAPEKAELVTTAAAWRRIEADAAKNNWSPPIRQQWKSRQTLEWPELTTPAELARSIEKLWGIEIQGDFPHDHLAAGKLSKVLFADALSVLAANSDQTFSINPQGDRCLLRPLEQRDRSLTMTFPGIAIEKLTQTASLFPNLRIENRGSEVLVRGSYNQLQRLDSALKQPAEQLAEATGTPVTPLRDSLAIPNRPGKKVSSGKYETLKLTMRAEQVTRQTVLDQLVKSGIPVAYDPEKLNAAGLDLETRIRLDADNMPLFDVIKSLFPENAIQVGIKKGQVVIEVPTARP